MSARFVLVAVVSACLATVLQVGPANASFPGSNGRLVHNCTLVDTNGVSHSEICTTKLDGTGRQFVTDTRRPLQYWDPAWSPDGKWITYAAQITNAYDDNIWIRKPGDPSSAFNVTKTVGTSDGMTWYRHYHPSFSRDGGRIVFSAQYQVEGEDLEMGIFTIKTDGTGRTLVYPDTTIVPTPKWSPTTDRILFDCTDQAWDPWTEQWIENQELCSMKADGTDVQNLTDSLEYESTYFDWSPDGSKIVFTRMVQNSGWPGVSDIWVMNANGSGQQMLYGNGTRLDAPVWSPDGTKILFGATVWNEFDQLETVGMLMDADGTDVAQHDGAWGNWQACTAATACDLVAPNTLLDQQPATTTGSASATFAFHASEPGATFQCQMDWQGFAACSSPATYSDLFEGEHVFEVRAVDASGNEDTSPAEWHWTVDLTPPDTYISGFTHTGNRAAFELEGFEDGVTFLCSLDGSPFSACDTPKTYTDLVPGKHVFRAKSRDAAGNVDASAASQAWTVPKLGTTTTLSVTVKPGKVIATGALTPAHPGDAMAVKLQRKKPSGLWGVVATANSALDADSHYAASFARRDGTCRVVASFPGDEDHKPSSKTSTQFHC